MGHEIDYEEIVLWNVEQLSGRAAGSIDLNDRLELHLNPDAQQQLQAVVGENVPAVQSRDFEAENEIVADPATSLADVVYYMSYLAGKVTYPRPPAGK